MGIPPPKVMPWDRYRSRPEKPPWLTSMMQDFKDRAYFDQWQEARSEPSTFRGVADLPPRIPGIGTASGLGKDAWKAQRATDAARLAEEIRAMPGRRPRAVNAQLAKKLRDEHTAEVVRTAIRERFKEQEGPIPVGLSPITKTGRSYRTLDWRDIPIERLPDFYPGTSRIASEDKAEAWWNAPGQKALREKFTQEEYIAALKANKPMLEPRELEPSTKAPPEDYDRPKKMTSGGPMERAGWIETVVGRDVPEALHRLGRVPGTALSIPQAVAEAVGQPEKIWHSLGKLEREADEELEDTELQKVQDVLGHSVDRRSLLTKGVQNFVPDLLNLVVGTAGALTTLPAHLIDVATADKPAIDRARGLTDATGQMTGGMMKSWLRTTKDPAVALARNPLEASLNLIVPGLAAEAGVGRVLSKVSPKMAEGLAAADHLPDLNMHRRKVQSTLAEALVSDTPAKTMASDLRALNRVGDDVAEGFLGRPGRSDLATTRKMPEHLREQQKELAVAEDTLRKAQVYAIVLGTARGVYRGVLGPFELARVWAKRNMFKPGKETARWLWLSRADRIPEDMVNLMRETSGAADRRVFEMTEAARQIPKRLTDVERKAIAKEAKLDDWRLVPKDPRPTVDRMRHMEHQETVQIGGREWSIRAPLEKGSDGVYRQDPKNALLQHNPATDTWEWSPQGRLLLGEEKMVPAEQVGSKILAEGDRVTTTVGGKDVEMIRWGKNLPTPEERAAIQAVEAQRLMANRYGGNIAQKSRVQTEMAKDLNMFVNPDELRTIYAPTTYQNPKMRERGMVEDIAADTGRDILDATPSAAKLANAEGRQLLHHELRRLGIPIEARMARTPEAFEAEMIKGGMSPEKAAKMRDVFPPPAQTIKLMPEILHGYARFNADIGHYQRMRGMARNPGLSMSNSAYKKMEALDPLAAKEWKRFPGPEVKLHPGMKGSPPKYGEMAGRWSHADVYEEMANAMKLQHDLQGILPKLISLWKSFKTTWSPGTTARNILTNVFLFAPLAGISLLNPMNLPYYRQALQDLLFEKKSMAFKDALSGDALGGTLVRTEIAPRPELGFLRGGFNNSTEPFKRFMDAFFEVSAEGKGLLPKLSTGVAKGSWNAIKGIHENVGKFYNACDEVFRLALFYKRRAEGLKAGTWGKEALLKAGGEAREKFVDYENVPGWVQVARAPYAPYGRSEMHKLWFMGAGQPFAAFTARATPLWETWMVQNPQQALFYESILHYITDEMFNDAELETAKQMQGALPWYERYRMVPAGMIHPSLATEGKEPRAIGGGEVPRHLFIDASFFTPISALVPQPKRGEQTTAQILGYLGRLGFGQNPVITPIAEALFNYDLTFKKKIYDSESTTPGHSLGRGVSHMLRKWAPGFIPSFSDMMGEFRDGSQIEGGYQYEKTVASAEGRPDARGRERPMWMVLADVLGGIKLAPHTSEELGAGVANHLRKMDEQVQADILRENGKPSEIYNARHPNGELTRDARDLHEELEPLMEARLRTVAVNDALPLLRALQKADKESLGIHLLGKDLELLLDEKLVPGAALKKFRGAMGRDTWLGTLWSRGKGRMMEKAIRESDQPQKLERVLRR